MAKKARSALVLSPDKWVPLNEAFARAKAALGSSDLALLDLHGHMRSGRLRSAVRCVNRDGTEMSKLLEASSWEASTLREGFAPGPDENPRRSGTVRVHDRGEPLYPRARRWYFVWRSDLDKRYPPAPQAGQEAETSTHRKPGRKTTKNWRLHVAGELHRIVVAENKPVPAASELATFCVKKLNYHPDIRAVQRLVKLLIG